MGTNQQDNSVEQPSATMQLLLFEGKPVYFFPACPDKLSRNFSFSRYRRHIKEISTRNEFIIEFAVWIKVEKLSTKGVAN